VKVFAAISALLLAPAGLLSWFAPQSARPPAGAISYLDSVETRILELVNEERRKQRLSSLQLDETLRAIARNHDDDMLARNFFGHVNPSGEGPSDRIARQHRRLIGMTGENIWESSGDYPSRHPDLAAEIMQAWMKSPGHRENILRKEFTHLGVGVCAAGREIRATQEFAGIRALLTHPLPAAVKYGTAVDLSTSGSRSADMFDIWSKQTGRALTRAERIPGARLEAPPGVYVLRFYFVRAAGSFVIYEGPSIEIR
jgi:uncharacterized protein YkwD